jgi:hypothetical protein
MAISRFVDGTSASVNMLNSLLQTYMPLRIDWTMGPTSCTLQLAGLTIRINNKAGINVTAASDTIPRRHLDPMRKGFRDVLQAALSRWALA